MTNPSLINLEIRGVLSPPNFPFGTGSSIVIGENASLVLGEGCYVGRYVEIGPTTKISIGDYSSIQDRCVILGDVSIGRYCTFAPNIFISSGKHIYNLYPWMNIKDQDAMVASTPELRAQYYTYPIKIEDDVWLGVNVVIMKGVTVGKGSVIGSSSVVTHDIPPYSVAVGSPARVIKKRLEFNPPEKISWEKEEDLPYFYEGFLVSKEEQKIYKLQNGLGVKQEFRVALNSKNSKTIHIKAKKIVSEEIKIEYSGKEEKLDSIFKIISFPLSNFDTDIFEFKIISPQSLNNEAVSTIVEEVYLT
jgi:acetyltransferase-like isoleucine patch superfamily enzyme